MLKFYFEKEKCRNCPHRQECIGKASTVGKVFEISVNTPEYYEYSQREKQPEFIEKYKKRADIERKNAEMKRFHGLARARGYGLRSVSFQAKLTAIAVNLKRIAKLLSPKIMIFQKYVDFKWTLYFLCFYWKFEEKDVDKRTFLSGLEPLLFFQFNCSLHQNRRYHFQYQNKNFL